MKKRILQIVLFVVACSGIMSCINLQHYTFRVCTYVGSYYAPGLRGQNGDGYYSTVDDLRTAYKEQYGKKEPVFNQDYYYHIRLFPQFTFYVPLGSDIRKEVFTRRVREIEDQNVSYTYLNNNGRVVNETYTLPAEIENRSFWTYNENLVNNYVFDQDLSLLLTSRDISALRQKCALKSSSWVNEEDSSVYVKHVDYDSLVAKGFLGEQIDTDKAGIKVNTINVLIFAYNKVQ